jgi:tetrahydromethanopterin S-methyltransferase subunit G
MECFDIMEARAYAAAKQRIEQSESESDVPWSPVVQRVWDNIGLDYKERMRRRDA